MMIKRLLAFAFSVLVLLLPCVSFAELVEDDMSIEEFLIGPDGEEIPLSTNTDGSWNITVTCTGDLTVGGDNFHKKGGKFYSALKKNNDNISFTMANVREIFRQDDLTLVNFEGTFTTTKYVPNNKKSNQFLFNIDPKYVTILTDNYIEAVSLENNHVMDHGDEGYEDTRQTLRENNVVYSNSEEFGVYQVRDVQIAMLSYLCIDRYDKPVDGYSNLYEKVAADIKAAKADNGYDIVIVSFHWGREKDYVPTENQIRMGRHAVDSGADLVIGHHSHRINPIEEYNGVYICYSLGNFCFAGNDKPSDMSSFLFQTRFKVTKEGDVSPNGFRIIPIRISSLKDKNDYIPTPFTEDFYIDAVLKTLNKNGTKLDYHVSEYPLEWKD